MLHVQDATVFSADMQRTAILIFPYAAYILSVIVNMYSARLPTCQGEDFCVKPNILLVTLVCVCGALLLLTCRGESCPESCT
jgi:hypothetical protein